ncbi:MAG: hypothetical protein ACRD8W_24135 [Nitrososphaeraceae archaeon]
MYQGKEGEIVYSGTMTPIEGDRGQATLNLIQTLRNEQPVENNLEAIRKIVLDLAGEAERLEYVFCTHQHEFIQNRFGWIQDALIEDIQSYIDGTQAILDGKITTGHHPAGGNLSIPILVCTGLELVSALYVGMTKYLDEKNYRAEDNVAKFIDNFFPEHLKNIPRILWDGVRNGIDHLFVPKSMQCAQNRIHFNFRREEQNSDVYPVHDIIIISINVITFHGALRQAIADYKKKLQNDDELQSKFINAWSSIEEYHHSITNDNRKINELNHLIEQLNRNGRVDLFQGTNQ